MKTRALVAVAVVLGLTVLLSVIHAADLPVSQSKTYPEATLGGAFVLVNLKTVEAPFILKSPQVVSIGGRLFVRGVIADIGDDPRAAGITASLALDDVTAFREFTTDQAKKYYGSNFREPSPKK